MGRRDKNHGQERVAKRRGLVNPLKSKNPNSELARYTRAPAKPSCFAASCLRPGTLPATQEG